MPSIIETLDQTEFWYGQDGRPFRIETMEQSHRINVYHFLLRRAEDLFEHNTWVERRLVAAAPDEVFDDWLHGLNEHAQQWLLRRPFMRALDEAIKAHSEPDPKTIVLVCAEPVDDEQPAEWRRPRMLKVRWNRSFLLSTHKSAQVAHLLNFGTSKMFLDPSDGRFQVDLRAWCGWNSFSWHHRGLCARLEHTPDGRRVCPACERNLKGTRDGGS